ncbi:ribonucleotide reductase subunit alpha [Halomonas campisalis]|uniref:Ribonucleotide reductase subunit alpha n=1 Tax=Billgrantia campisalis TaxID=74661 RepID=A0ABS9P499_9GAMM|nr:ribonucleotide reductase subunit alpha [Halomonas campisalis]MCG6656603.1 ribonucleotide reductase subunit alpha [Halomonas campisalis]MDR5861790.1 ribonucleotide reductase subunit alpha [Halomonas campisalis]
MAISCFADLLNEAHSQPDPQRLLFVFTRAELPDNPTPEQRARFEQGEGGVLTPVLCVDKTLDELSDMAALVAESKETEIEWDIVFVAALAGSGPRPPSSDEAESHLQRMVESLKMGNIESFLALDRQGEVVSFQ